MYNQISLFLYDYVIIREPLCGDIGWYVCDTSIIYIHLLATPGTPSGPSWGKPAQTPPKDCLRSPKEKPYRWRSSTMVTSLKRWKAEEELSAKSTGLKPWHCSTERLSIHGRIFKGYFKAGVRKLHWFDARCFHEKSWGWKGLKKGNWRVEKFCRCNKQLYSPGGPIEKWHS